MSAVWKTRDDLEAEVARLLEYNTASYDAINAAMRRAEAAEDLVEELQKQRRCVKHPDAERLDGCAECVADEILIARRKTEAAEAERDHFKKYVRHHESCHGAQLLSCSCGLNKDA